MVDVSACVGDDVSGAWLERPHGRRAERRHPGGRHGDRGGRGRKSVSAACRSDVEQGGQRRERRGAAAQVPERASNLAAFDRCGCALFAVKLRTMRGRMFRVPAADGWLKISQSMFIE